MPRRMDVYRCQFDGKRASRARQQSIKSFAKFHIAFVLVQVLAAKTLQLGKKTLIYLTTVGFSQGKQLPGD